VISVSYTLKARFQNIEVNTRNMAAASTPSADSRKIPMKTATAAGKNPRMGTDCSTSSVGRMMRRANGERAARRPTARARVTAKK
jgi:hypothetical protein